MKKPVRCLTFLFLAASLLIAPQSAFAQQVLLPGSAAQIDRLQSRCDSIMPTLRQLHTTDALLRVNIGQVYNGVSSNLMVRLNSRLALNRIDSTKFVDITNRFESSRSEFSSSYNEYEEAMAKLLKIDCKSKPTEFYAQLIKTRDARKKLANRVENLNNLLSEYRVEVERLQQDLKDKGAKGEN
ncbi:hypothetical protein CR969_02820 [Candidatus Saccharibacteria bacterium]|nr:MAG: hypothetical protein CR969_02820 [Candidatus Saccharibacteria bacterium]